MCETYTSHISCLSLSYFIVTIFDGLKVTIQTHPKVGREDVVGGDHHILRGQKPLAPVALGAVVQIDVELHVGLNVLLELVLHTQKQKHGTTCNTWKSEASNFSGKIKVVLLIFHAELIYFLSQMKAYIASCETIHATYCHVAA